MSDSLRDQLLGLGFKPAPKPERSPPAKSEARGGKPSPSAPRPPSARPNSGRPHPGRTGQAAATQGKPARGKPSRGEMDLAKAYAIRAQKEKDERIAAERARQEEAARRREGKQKLAELLKTAALNDAAADIARHFEYGGKIRRVYVTAEQLRAVNAGELAVVQQGGRYALVSPAHARESEALLAGSLALLVDPNAPAENDVYADPKYQVPDDLVW
jgi:uncharacterized protein YaiL (DUF2058 family)